MRRTLSAVVILLLAGASHAQEDAAAILEKGIQAHGGEAKLAKVKAATWRAKGTIYGAGDPTPYTGEWALQFPAQARVILEMEINGVPIKHIRVLDRDKGWIKQNRDDAYELDDDLLTEDRRQVGLQWLATLLPLRDKAFTLTTLPETKIDGTAAVGIKATAKDRPDVRLYFDKEKGLLLRFESPVKDPKTGKDIRQEILYSDYKEVDGVQKAMKMTIRREGKKYLEQEIADFRLKDKIDDRTFGKP